MASAFCENPDPQRLTTADHIDGDKQNNRADNLRWMSLEDNVKCYYERRKKNDTNEENT